MSDAQSNPAPESPAGQNPSGLRIEFESQPRLHAVLEQNDVPAVPRFVLHNDGMEELHDLRLSVELADLSRPFELTIDRIGPRVARKFEPLPVRLDGEALRRIRERDKLSWVLRIEQRRTGDEDGPRELLREEFPVEVFPIAEWPGLAVLPELTAAFVFPNARAIDPLLAATAALLSERTGRGALDGTTSRDKERMRATVRAVYDTLAALGLAYALPPASFEDQGQKVRLPDDVLASKLGTCLDTSFLLASILEQAGLHPLVVFTEGHAFVACWLSDQTFAECVVRDGQRLRKRIDLDEIVVVETTMLTERNADFDLAQKRGRTHLDDLEKFHLAIDVRQARRLKIRPLPLRVNEAPRSAGVDPSAPSEESLEVRRAAPPAESSSESPTSGTPAPSSPSATPAIDPTSGSPMEAEGPELSGGRIGSWKRRLLDLSLRNRLLNFREGKRTVRLFAPDLAALEDAMSGRGWFTCRPLPAEIADPKRDAARTELESGEDPKLAFSREELSSSRLHVELGQSELDHRLLDTYRSARLSLEESGAGSLYLSIGMLEWYEADSSSEPRRAPLLLIPLEIDRLSAREGFRVRISDDDPQVNVTLLEKLQSEFGVETSGLDDLPTDEDGLDVTRILDGLRRAVLPLPRAEVIEEAWIGLFSFKKFLMWRDLQARTDDLLKNRVLKHLVERPGASFEPEFDFPEIESLDRDCSPIEMPCPLNADSSQLRAVVAATTGRSFVLEGPPGTGKSQTITNLIATCLARGQRVLFVAEKRAALEVVRDRLGRVGLDAFCLELHSNKANKRDVLESLAEPLDLATQKSPRQWQQAVRDLLAEREALNDFVETLHRERASGETLFELTARLVVLRDQDRLPFDAPEGEAGTAEVDALDLVDEAFLSERREALSRALAALREIGPPALHPLRGLGGVRWSATVVERGEEALQNVDGSVSRYGDALGALARRIEFDSATASSECLAALLRISSSLESASRGITRALLVEPDWARVRERALATLEQGRDASKLASHVEQHFSPKIREASLGPLKSSIERAAGSFWPLSWLRGRGARKELRAYVRDRLPSNPELVRWLEQAQELVDREAVLDGPGHEGTLWFDSKSFKAGRLTEAEVTALREAVEQVGKFRADLKAFLLALAKDRRDPQPTDRVKESLLVLYLKTAEQGVDPTLQLELERLQTTAEEMRQERARLCAAMAIEGDPLSADEVASEQSGADTEGQDRPLGYLEAVQVRLRRWRSHLRDRLRDWTFWLEARSELERLGCHHLLAALERDPAASEGEGLALSAERAVDVFERSWREALWNHIHDSEELVRRFHGPDHERRIQRFRELDQRVLDLSQEVTRAKLCAQVPDFGREVSEASEVGLLKRELRKKRRHLPVRKLLEQTRHLVPRLKPCFLMSPLSVAQYLDAGDAAFDLVVFDEASQIAPWDAVGAIARGKHCVVVGDSRQLPPTSFFQSVDGEEFGDDEDIEDLESILDEFSAAGFRALDLSWHYRSRHESLIAFSNFHYYQNRLLTFPSPGEDLQGMGLRVQPVPDGVYDRSKTRTNRLEAESVVADLCERLRSGSDASVGVVTFSMAQRELIEDLLDAERRKSPELERFFADDVEEPVFVKNLENVQGDERDVILFSIGYGPDAAGKVSMHFGPLNLSGGERRLNVAVTRSRRQIVVHSTLRADQIDLRRTQAEGVKGLKNFLEYAEQGSQALVGQVEDDGHGEAESPFEAEVADALRRRGHDVAFQIGCSGYRIDLAIRDTEFPGRFLLGVECDGANYHSAKTARDRDRIRESVLRGLGWDICRIWSTDWWRHPAREVERVEQALEQARMRLRAQAIAAAEESSESEASVDASSEPERFAGLDSDRQLSAPGEPRGLDGSADPQGESGTEVREQPAAEPEALAAEGSEAVAPPGSPSLSFSGAQRYERSEIPVLGTGEQFYEQGSADASVRLLLQILEVEAPISERLLQRRLVSAFDQRLTSRAKARVADLVASLPKSKRPLFADGIYWRSDQSPDSYEGYRVPDDKDSDPRDAEDLPIQEVTNAVVEVVRAAIALPRLELVREASRRFGFKRVGSKVEAAIEAGIDRALELRAVRPGDDDQIVVGE